MTTVADRTRPDLLAHQGYVVVQGLFTPQDLEPVLHEYREVLDEVASALVADGMIADAHENLPFDQRLLTITREYGRSLSQHFDISLPFQGGLNSMTPIHLGPAIFELLTHPKMLDLVEEFVGPEIMVSPVQHFRTKMPEGLVGAGDGFISKIPWHQDNGVVLAEADQSEILTVWVALSESTVENGAMQVIPASTAVELMDHCVSATTGAFIPDHTLETERMVQLPMHAGDALLMHSRTPHSSAANVTTNQIRMSLDLRYQQVGTPTGRSQFPDFTARSRSNPASELHDWQVWARAWRDARDALAVDPPITLNRWGNDKPLCA
jgi:phytanoyl-CoA hydroxylase